MFSARVFNDSVFGRPSLFDQDPFFQTHSNTTVSEEKDYSQQQHDKDEHHQSTRSTPVRSEPQTSTPTPPHTAHSNRRDRGEDHRSRQLRPYEQEQRLGRWDDGFGEFGFGRGGWGMMDSMMSRMERLMSRLDQADTWPSLPGDGGQSSAYSYSSSSYTETGADGKPIASHSSSRQLRRIGDVLEESTHYKDLNGNERTTSKRGIANQMREVITDRNASGQERKIENLKGIAPEEVNRFDEEWIKATKKLDPKHQLLGHATTEQKSLLAGTNNSTPAQIAPAPKEKGQDVPAEKTMPTVDAHQGNQQRSGKTVAA